MSGCKSGTRLRYRLTLASGMLECLCFAGVVFGYASLVFVLKEDGYFSQLCINITGANDTLFRTGKKLGVGWDAHAFLCMNAGYTSGVNAVASAPSLFVFMPSSS